MEVSSHATRSTKRKAAGTLSDEPSRKRSLGISGSGRYITNLTGHTSFGDDFEPLTVRKATVKLTRDGQDLEWDESTYGVWISREAFSSGRTKQAFKLNFRNAVYAAKLFYDLGDGSSPTPEENLKHLKEEMLRLKTVQYALSRFNEAAKDMKISVFVIRAQESFLMEEDDVEGDARAWLVDRYLEPKGMRKYSGSDVAGRNTDFPGKTCDAFAHWVLEDSNFTFVPSDIQGIIHTSMVNNVPGPECLTLFDLMCHSKDGTMGLGDNGIIGIMQFCEQHECNSICRRFRLEATEKLLPTLKDEIDKRRRDARRRQRQASPDQPQYTYDTSSSSEDEDNGQDSREEESDIEKGKGQARSYHSHEAGGEGDEEELVAVEGEEQGQGEGDSQRSVESDGEEVDIV